MARVFISIGSNLGDRIKNCSRALELLGGKSGVEVVRRSSFYETEPWGRADQPPFVNCAAEIETGLSPALLLKVLKATEREAGRTASERWGPREIDLDIIFYSDLVLREGGEGGEGDLVIPHPLLHERAFVLVPLSEIAPDFVHPVLKKSVSELKDALMEKGGGRGGRVRRLES